MDKPIQGRINLQLFGEGEPVESVAPVEPSEPTEPVTPTEPVEPSEPTEPFLAISYNKEQVELDKEKAIELAQKGMNYDKVNERYQQLQNDPRLSFVENQAKKYGVSVDQYLEAVQEQEEIDEIKKLAETGNIPEEVAARLYHLEQRDKERQIIEQHTRQEREQEEHINNDLKSFNNAYPDVKPEDIPDSVFKDVENGSSLLDAYTRHENNLLKDKVTKLEESLGIREKNTENAETTTGSVTGNGNVQTSYFSKEQVEKMSQEDVVKNYDTIVASMKKW